MHLHRAKQLGFSDWSYRLITVFFFVSEKLFGTKSACEIWHLRSMQEHKKKKILLVIIFTLQKMLHDVKFMLKDFCWFQASHSCRNALKILMLSLYVFYPQIISFTICFLMFLYTKHKFSSLLLLPNSLHPWHLPICSFLYFIFSPYINSYIWNALQYF